MNISISQVCTAKSTSEPKRPSLVEHNSGITEHILRNQSGNQIRQSKRRAGAYMEEPAAAWPENLESSPSRGAAMSGARSGAWSPCRPTRRRRASSWHIPRRSGEPNQNSTSTCSPRIHSNPRHPGAQITPNLQETPRIKPRRQPRGGDRRRDSEPQEGKNSGGGTPREGGGAAALDFGGPVELPSRRRNPARPQLEGEGRQAPICS